MHQRSNEKLWIAYLDGQMSAAEALEFEATLSPEERERLAQELRLESGLAECLREATPCPPELWARTAAAIGASRRPLLAHKKALLAGFASLAAALLVVLLPPYLDVSSQRIEPILVITDKNLEDFGSRSGCKRSAPAVQEFLNKRGIRLTLANLPANGDYDGHPLRLMGANERGCHGNPAMEILFSCCGNPVKVVIAEHGTRAAFILEDAARAKSVRMVAELGDYTVAVISPSHPTPDLLHMFEQGPAPASSPAEPVV